jgi:hypothetical protein
MFWFHLGYAVRKYNARSEKLVVRLGKQKLSNKTVAQEVCSVYHTSRIWESYKKEGSKAIKPDTLGHQFSPELNPDE